MKVESFEWFIYQEIKQWLSQNALANEIIKRFGYSVEFIPNLYSLERNTRIMPIAIECMHTIREKSL